ncbi:MAG: Clp1/GlmU family protein, partial [Candidatus Thiodiazotropha endolucinida]
MVSCDEIRQPLPGPVNRHKKSSPPYGPAQMKRHFSAAHPESLAELLLARARRVVLVGPPGIGKSTLANALAESLHKAGRPVHCLAADPGMPAFGIPGAVNLGL